MEIALYRSLMQNDAKRFGPNAVRENAKPRTLSSCPEMLGHAQARPQTAAFLPGRPEKLEPPQNVLQGGSLEHPQWQRAAISIYRSLYDHSPCRPDRLSQLLQSSGSHAGPAAAIAAATQPAIQFHETEAACIGESATAHAAGVRWSRGVQRNVDSWQMAANAN